MGVEIERKYLVNGEGWKAGVTGTLYRQGYLSTEPDRTVRIRIMDQQAVLSIKGRTVGATRPEFEYEIPLADALSLHELCVQPLIEKTRYKVAHGGLVWEIDEFHGANDGLVIAECELAAEDQPIDKPDWVGSEVTADPRYYNSNLIAHPYSAW